MSDDILWVKTVILLDVMPMVRRYPSNTAQGEISVTDESTMQIEKCWVSSENKNRLLQRIREIVVAHSLSVRVVLNGIAVNQEHIPAPSTIHNRQNQL